MTKDWYNWHADYDDPDSPLSRRLAEVRPEHLDGDRAEVLVAGRVGDRSRIGRARIGPAVVVAARDEPQREDSGQDATSRSHWTSGS